ncbi:MAG: hypothetical protein FJ293_05320 [Planctomycetes bacterium]|nr:hypothetical protein [Planctomycetota bacterium]
MSPVAHRLAAARVAATVALVALGATLVTCRGDRAAPAAVPPVPVPATRTQGAPLAAAPPLEVRELRCEARRDPLGIGESLPRLTWQVRPADDGDPRDRAITATELRAAATRERLWTDAADLWHGALPTADADACLWPGPPLASRAEVHWQVRVRDEAGRWSDWSAPARFTVGLLAESDWSADWIGAPGADRPERDLAPWLRTTIDLPAAPIAARAFVASFGWHELWINGAPVGDDLLAPSGSDLARRVRVIERECTAALRPGRNVIGLWLGAGWARHAAAAAASHPLACAEFDLLFADGQRLRLRTDERWEAATSDRTARGSFEIGDYGGERVDAARSRLPWCDPAVAGSADDPIDWQPARRFAGALAPDVARIPEPCEPNRRIAELAPRAIDAAGPAAWRIDFGRCFTGVVRAALRGEPGATLTLSMSDRTGIAEVAGQSSELVLDARGEGTFEHRFSYVAGRWLTVTGTSSAPRTDDVRAWAVRTGFDRTSEFACGDPQLQAIHDIACATFECLALGGVPVDCPHRERLGYGGDAHATLGTALPHYEATAFFAGWLDEWRAAQAADGDLPFTVPVPGGGGGPAWSGIVVTLPFELWRRSGDRRHLDRAWPSIERWLAWLDRHVDDGVLEPPASSRFAPLDQAFLGDWLPPGSVPAPMPPSEPTRLFNSCYRLGAMRTAAAIAAARGDAESATRLAEHAARDGAALHARFFREPQRRYPGRRDTPFLMARHAGLGTPELRAELHAEWLDRVAADPQPTGGIHGTWRTVTELLDAGRPDLLVRLAQRREPPGYGSFLAQGLTTFPEDWDARLSLIHACWLSIGVLGPEALLGVRPAAGSDPAAVGFRRFTLAPAVASDVPWARGRVATPHGPVAVDWRRADGGTVALDVVVPLGTQAELLLPATAAGDWSAAPGARAAIDHAFDAAGRRWRAILTAGRHSLVGTPPR